MKWEIEKIIVIANELQRTGTTDASTGEQIAAAFVLNRMECLPSNYQDVMEAWECLGTWQAYVKCIKSKYMHLIEEAQ